jgi:hypothetical protein
MLARTAAQPRAGQLQLAEPRPEDDGLVILAATASTAARAGHTRGQERRNLAAQYPVLQLQEQRPGLGQRQTQVLQSVVVLVQHDEVVDGHLLVVLGDDHELKLEAPRHVGDPQRWKDPATVSARARQQEGSAPTLLSSPPTPLDQNPAWREVNRQLNATARINLVSNRLRERTVRFRCRFSELSASTAGARRGGL